MRTLLLLATPLVASAFMGSAPSSSLRPLGHAATGPLAGAARSRGGAPLVPLASVKCSAGDKSEGYLKAAVTTGLSVLLLATSVGTANVVAADGPRDEGLSGEQLFFKRCTECHADGGNRHIKTSTLMQADLERNKRFSVEEIEKMVTNGYITPNMPEQLLPYKMPSFTTDSMGTYKGLTKADIRMAPHPAHVHAHHSGDYSLCLDLTASLSMFMKSLRRAISSKAAPGVPSIDKDIFLATQFFVLFRAGN